MAMAVPRKKREEGRKARGNGRRLGIDYKYMYIPVRFSWWLVGSNWRHVSEK